MEETCQSNTLDWSSLVYYYFTYESFMPNKEVFSPERKFPDSLITSGLPNRCQWSFIKGCMPLLFDKGFMIFEKVT